MPAEPWYKTTMRWGQTNLVECDPARYDKEWWREHWRKTRVEGVIVNAGGIVAYYPSKFELHHRAEKLGERDLYGEVVAAAREEGLKVIARMDSNRVAQDFFEAHPDWICRKIDGEPYTQGDKFVTCIGSPYYTEYLPGVMEEIIERSQPDGFADNSWAGLSRDKICYCQHCRAQFNDFAQRELPSRRDWSDEGYRDWIRWNFQRRTDLWALNNRVTTAAGGPDCAWMGMISGEVLHNSQRFIDLQQILAQCAIVMLDHQRRNPFDGFEQNTEAGKRLHEMAGWDKLIPESMPQYQLGQPAFRLSSMPEPEVRLWATSGFAGGIQPWWHHIGSLHEDRRQYRSAEPLFLWHEANQDILVDREIRPDVGIVWSQQNHDYYGRDDAREKTMAPYRGVVKAMDRSGIPYLPLHADDIAGAIERVGVIVLPNVGALSDDQLRHVEDYVAAGGSVIATGETSAVSTYGDARGDLALAKLFGLRRGEGSHGATGEIDANIENWSRHSYLRLSPENRAGVYGPGDATAPASESERHPILKGLERTDTLPFGGYLPVMSADEDVEVLATYIRDFPIFPPETSWMREPRTDLPAITVKTAPSGGKLIWFVADLDRCFARDESFEHALLLANAVRWSLGDRVTVSISGGHGVVTAEHYRQGDRHILHLNNRLQLSRVPGRQYDLVPIGPIEIRLRTGQSASTVDLRVSGKAVPATQEGDELVFTVEKLLDHEVVVIG
ncbi:beta-galactosidase [Mesorhizobium sp. BR1-1-16]|uniref:alpha-amylase family protein n=1 Tax=Mesorhizobium sp. BR1-1-16 TaxID=2876653 RepID=UPI001CCB221C|nr:alpha-amylase family protein [Mesorhizobium sp. BR1-1-16]MBZ9937221.1 beta-galactosidase [Mesorhizobium sp. BR1-1-16]